MLKKIFYFITSFLFLFVNNSYAGIVQASIQLREEFNKELVKTIMDTMIQNEFIATLSWQMFIYCFAIGLFYTMSKVGSKNFLHEMTRFFIKVWIVLLVVNPTFTGIKNPLTGGNERLHVWAYLTVKNTFDSAAKTFGREESLATNIDKLISVLDNINQARIMCKNTEDLCWKNYLQGTLVPDYEEAKKQEEEKRAKLTGMDAIASFVSEAVIVIGKAFSNPAYFIFPLLMGILSMAQGFMTMFVLLGLGITTAFALMMTGIFTPLILVNTSFEGRVLSLYKMVFAAGLFTFVHKLILWIATVVTGAIHDATVKIFIKKIVALIGSGQGFAMFGGTSVGLGILLMSNFVAVFVILFMQIVAVAKIPSISKDIMNLSLNTIVNLGETLLGAAMGMAQMVGSSLLGSTIGGMVGSLMDKGADSIEGGANESKQQMGSSGSGGQEGATNVTNNFSGGVPGANGDAGTPSTNQAALSSAKKDVLKAGKSDGLDLKQKTNTGMKGMIGDAFSRKNIANAVRGTKSIGGKVLGFGANAMWDSMNAGLGKGNGLGTINKGIKDATGAIPDLVMNKMPGMASAARDSYKQYFSPTKGASAQTQSEFLAASNQTKNNLDENSKNQMINLADKIKTGEANTKDFDQFYKMSNQYDTNTIKNELKNVNINDDYNLFVQGKNEVNDSQMNIAMEEINKNGDISEITMSNLNQLITSGNLDPSKLKDKISYKDEFIKNMKEYENEINLAGENGVEHIQRRDNNGKVIDGQMVSLDEAKADINDYKNDKNNQKYNLADALNEKSKAKTLSRMDSLYEKSQKEGLSGEERKELYQLASNGKSLLKGDKDRIKKLEQVFGDNNTKKFQELKDTDEEIFQKINTKQENELEDDLKDSPNQVGYEINQNLVLNTEHFKSLKNKSDKKKIENQLITHKRLNQIIESEESKIRNDLLDSKGSFTEEEIRNELEKRLINTYNIKNKNDIKEILEKRKSYLENFKDFDA